MVSRRESAAEDTGPEPRSAKSDDQLNRRRATITRRGLAKLAPTKRPRNRRCLVRSAAPVRARCEHICAASRHSASVYADNFAWQTLARIAAVKRRRLALTDDPKTRVPPTNGPSFALSVGLATGQRRITHHTGSREHDDRCTHEKQAEDADPLHASEADQSAANTASEATCSVASGVSFGHADPHAARVSSCARHRARGMCGRTKACVDRRDPDAQQ